MGPYNTQDAPDNQVGPHLKFGPKTAILKGIALDLKTQIIFPAVFNWGQMSDFQTQIQVRFLSIFFWSQNVKVDTSKYSFQDRARIKAGLPPLDTEDYHKTEDSTFKPKSLRNRAKEHMDKMKKEEKARLEQEARRKKREQELDPFGMARLKPTGINESGARNRKKKSKFVDFHALNDNLKSKNRNGSIIDGGES